MNKEIKEKGLKNRENLIKIIEKAKKRLNKIPEKERPFKFLTQKKVSELLTTNDKTCTLRAVQYWLAEPESKSFRYCKDWVPIELEKRLILLKLLP